MEKIPTFRFWCQKVLPLVYDDSLSYYEVLCKVVEYLNKVIEDSNGFIGELTQLRKELDIVEKWIADFDTSYAEQIIEDSLFHMIFVGLSDNGYIVFYVPESWKDIIFNTTGYDISIPDMDYGHLVLSFDIGKDGM